MLSRFRAEAGFKSAYQFFHGNGGRRHFAFTFPYYLRLERRGSLPRPEWMASIMLALRLSPGEAAAQSLFLAYLKDLLRTQAAYELVLAPLLCRHERGLRPLSADAMRWIKAEHSVHLTPEQFAAISSSEAAYWCSELLCNDRGAWSAEELAKTLSLPLPAVKAGLARIVAAGIAKKAPGRKFKSRLAGKFYTFPGRLKGMKSQFEGVHGFWDKMASKRGGEVASRVELIRAEAGFIHNYTHAMAETLDLANTGGTHAKGENTGLYLIEARIRRLMPF